MRHVYICVYKNWSTNHQFVHIVCSNKKAAKEWLEKHAKPACEKWSKEEGEVWTAFYYRDLLFKNLPF